METGQNTIQISQRKSIIANVMGSDKLLPRLLRMIESKKPQQIIKGIFQYLHTMMMITTSADQ